MRSPWGSTGFDRKDIVGGKDACIFRAELDLPTVMTGLPQDAGPAAEFLVRHLYRPLDLAADARYFAMAETESTAEDAWFWSDDNAKILELMSRPEVARRFPTETAEILRFVAAMCDGPFIFRRVSAPRLDPAGRNGQVVRFRHSLLRIGWDPADGSVTTGVRFHDERDADNLTLCPGYVEFTYRRRRFKERLEASAARSSLELSGHSLRLRYAGEVTFSAGWQRRRLGTLAYICDFDARTMLFGVEAALDLDHAIEVRDAVLTIGNGRLDDCLFHNVVTDSGGDAPVFAAGTPSQRRFDGLAARYYAIRQGHISADALAVHSLPDARSKLSGIETTVETRGRLNTVMARYAFAGAHRGTRLSVREHKLVTAGGFYDRVSDYAAMMQRFSARAGAAQAAVDLSISYDYGVTLNAFARCFAAGVGGAPPTGQIGQQEVRSLFDSMLHHYCALYLDRHEASPNAIFSRELAFAMLGATTMFAATGDTDYRRRLERMCAVLLELGGPLDGPALTFRMRRDNPRAYLDCQSAALLALTRAAPVVEDRSLRSAIERGLASYCLVPAAPEMEEVAAIETLGLIGPGSDRSETAFWNYKAGLALRFFAALRKSRDPGLQAIVVRQHERIRSFEAALHRQLTQSVIERDGCAEFRTSVASRETNSETQPWVMLGLLGDPDD
jgi:hypothetical protein